MATILNLNIFNAASMESVPDKQMQDEGSQDRSTTAAEPFTFNIEI